MMKAPPTPSNVANESDPISSKVSTRGIVSGQKIRSVSPVVSTCDASNKCVITFDGSYTDYLQVPLAIIQQQMIAPPSKRKGPRGGVTVPFPTKLYEMLDGVERNNLDHICSWQTHGRSFTIHSNKLFAEHIMPKFFKQSKLASFQRQLNLYGFQRIVSGRDRGAYFHPLFLRGRKDIAKVMFRTRIKTEAIHENSACHGASVGGSLSASLYALPFCPLSTTTEAAGLTGQETIRSSVLVPDKEHSNVVSVLPDLTVPQSQELFHVEQDILEPNPILDCDANNAQVTSGLLDFHRLFFHQQYLEQSENRNRRQCLGGENSLDTDSSGWDDAFQPPVSATTRGEFEGRSFNCLDSFVL